MSFRTRLTSFFVLIVVIPMIAVGFLVFRLISDSQQGKTDARASGLATAARSLYAGESAAATDDAENVARLIGAAGPRSLNAKVVVRLTDQLGLARVVVLSGSTRLADVGDASALAPGIATLTQGAGSPPLTIMVSEITASQFIRDLSGPGVLVAVRQGRRTLGSSFGAATSAAAPRLGTARIDGTTYRVVTEALPGFAGPVTLTLFSSAAAASGSLTGSRVLAAAFIAAVLLLAFSFSVLASRGLSGQVSGFLQAARRLATGDFSSPIQTQGNDEFAALGQEFNNMSTQLERRLEELSLERARLSEAVTRIGQTFASNLDRHALSELALKTAIDAVQASGGRISVRSDENEPLAEEVREGSLDGAEEDVLAAERAALETGFGESASEGVYALSVAMAPHEPGQKTHGVITVVTRDTALSPDDRNVLRSLAAQASLALENVALHLQVSRQAVTDELTGLANHGRFQELIGLEVEQVRRYNYPLGLIMLDIDNFKSINDTHGHQQGDVVLRRVAKVVADTSRETDFPARYGGEEMALILPHTDIEGAYAIAERIRTEIEAGAVTRRDGQGVLRVTASLGVAASAEGDKDALIAEADAALYEAKRSGKNRTVIAALRSTKVGGAE